MTRRPSRTSPLGWVVLAVAAGELVYCVITLVMMWQRRS